MKALPLALLLALPFAVNAAEVRPGASVDEVRSVLGAPQGQMRIGDRQLLYYDRGEIELRSGSVTRVALRSVEEQAELVTRRAAAAVKIREEQEIRRARLIADGEALKTLKLADPSFQAEPLSYQVSFWEDFSRRYPDVPVAEQLTGARLLLAEQMEQRRVEAAQAERLAELEIRLRAAEARATEAGSVARRYRNYSSYYGGLYARRSFNLMPVDYRYYNAPVPVIRSPAPMQTVARGVLPGIFPNKFPAMFPGSFNGRNSQEPSRVDNNCHDYRGDLRRNGDYPGNSPHRNNGRNRM